MARVGGASRNDVATLLHGCASIGLIMTVRVRGRGVVC